VLKPLSRRLVLALTTTALMVAPGAFAAAKARRSADLRVERVVMLFRHGIRAPLPGEAVEKLSAQPWPVWSTPPSLLTPHGREAMRLLGVYDRARFAAQGLLARSGCPGPGVVEIWTNTAERTISSGEALAQGLAPGCGLAVGHLAPDSEDPLFHPYEAKAVSMDPPTAAAQIKAETGGAEQLIAPHARRLALMETILGCGPAPRTPTCDLLHQPGDIRVSGDGKGLDIIGPIDTTSGTAQVLALQYAEGFPLDQVGWGRATRARLTEVSRLHALLFEVYSRPRYMAARLAGPMGRHVLERLTAADAPKVTLLVGHDDNIAALASLAGVHFQVASYGYDDPPVGGALGFEVLRDRRTGARYVRAFYQAQTLDQLRNLTQLGVKRPPALQALPLPDCARRGARLCRLADFAALMNRRLAL
jgi:4-phytase/acid phosphatase